MKTRYWLFLTFIVILTLLPSASAYCNETITTVHADPTQASSDYNQTVTRTCTNEFSTTFTYIALLYITLLILLATGIFLAKNNIMRLVLAIPLNLVLILALQTSTLFIQASNPSLSGVAALLNTLFYFCIALVMPSLVIPFMLIVWKLIKNMLNPRRDKNKDWELD